MSLLFFNNNDEAGDVTLLDDFKKFVKDAEGGTQFQKWAKDNPGELNRWNLFKNEILKGNRPTAPAMLTPHGRELIDAGILYLHGTK